MTKAQASRLASLARAQARFMTLKAEMDANLKLIQQASQDHFGDAPEVINWGHVGSMEEAKRYLDLAMHHLGCKTFEG